ncbi:MAG: electron transfer flavoprotein subunit alpha [Rhodobiaceae bacterium]|nr:electron transfer flavoprotein subunit alpha [Rhodobiaceae bacterium]|tara:strand:- start:1886 stop:2830 length:945 start_codon:yes stop_codon:yes gene_type:complete
MSILVLAEHNNEILKEATKKAISAASKIANPVHVLVAGIDCANAANDAASTEGVEKVLLAENSQYKNMLSEPISELLIDLMSEYDYLVSAATTNGKNILPRVAAKLDVSQISEIIGVINGKTFQRPIYAGNAIATVESSTDKNVITIRTTAFETAKESKSTAEISSIGIEKNPGLSEFVEEKVSGGERPELTSAGTIVSGGRGMQSGDNFKLLESVADKLGAAVGASRAAVDAGFVPNEYQVGQTGKVVAPELYIAVGISGAIQHLAGMKDSKVIVAINKDDEAPIFEVADYGLVADLFDAVPDLDKELEKIQK